jgi:hypothetical protein
MRARTHTHTTTNAPSPLPQQAGPLLLKAAERGDAAEVRRLIAAGAAVDFRDEVRTYMRCCTHA